MSMGSDSHAVIDPFEETRAIELDHRLASLRRGTHRAGQLLHIATASGCRSLGWKDAGRLASGALADFVTVSLTSPRLAGTDPVHAAAAVVFAATASVVQHVVVGGKVIVADGVHQSIDVGAELARTIAAVWS
jgi:cytosine/adenosine deaminase-related metal-dependent hydrolase